MRAVAGAYLNHVVVVYYDIISIRFIIIIIRITIIRIIFALFLERKHSDPCSLSLFL